MTEQEITQGTITVIAQNSNYSYQNIDELYNPPDKDVNLDTFISAGMKSRLAKELQRQFRCIGVWECTQLTNDLFGSITTLGALIRRIKTYCP